ncbi:SecY-interacting protein [Algicola sagamiensis]|uniref:SecY-interacting protein n=1 Tax=Algicola sagamiensis TaxID=163869 RepID=UPI0003653497|nr:SecY-interacting protein [Algicola sagamiensis]
MKNTFMQAWEAWLERFVTQHEKEYNRLPVTCSDDEWPSPCDQGKSDDDEIFWRPVPQPHEHHFENVEEALEMQLNEQLKWFYTSFYAEPLTAKHPRGDLQLLLPWNEADFKRLQENLIAHVLMKRRLKQRETLFIATTDEDDWMISILNETGEVVLERVGKEPQEVLAPDLLSFFSHITPVAAY